MTIKRRLFVSNILMIVLPIALTIALSFTIYFALVSITGIDPVPARPGAFSVVEASRSQRILQSENYMPVEHGIVLYQSDSGRYVLVIPDNIGSFSSRDAATGHAPLFMFFFLSIIVLLTNFMLTRYISSSIMTSIDTLVNGVRELSEGNLTYRIQYDKRDEFEDVCASFNDMALRLSDMVRQRQEDENNRKELIAGISHDLRTPLTSIKAYIEGLRNGVASTAEMQEKYLETIQHKTEDIEYIIRQLFKFSKMDIGDFPLNFELVDIGQELEKITAGLTEEYRERGLSISLSDMTKGEHVLIDTVQFRNVMQNILDNSIKYTDKVDSTADISCQKANEAVVIRIKDNGPGVNDAMLTKLFAVFFRGDTARSKTGKGSGLGLAISSKIIERLSGSITAENDPEGGLCIVITLPLADGGH
jgi:signal transduction histidine kinase